MILYKSKVARLTWLKTLIILILIVSAIQAIILLHSAIRSAYYHVFQEEVDYKARYGDGSWVIITGGSSGQGRHFSLNFAARGFNLLLIGSRRSLDVKKEINTIYRTVEVRIIFKDFSDAFDHDFFEEIEKGLEDIPNGRISFLINNVGMRVGYKPHHKMPTSLIRSTIACGTITQAMMTRLCLPYLLNREHSSLYSGIISITAQVMHPNHTFGIAEQNDLYFHTLRCMKPLMHLDSFTQTAYTMSTRALIIRLTC
jgi:NAD(P)-dependent dehydrogenase (short-subunit alcohol dehydrogenase family)